MLEIIMQFGGLMHPQSLENIYILGWMCSAYLTTSL